MSTSLKQLLEAAHAAVPRITAGEAQAMMEKGDTLVVDVRDAPEVEASGTVKGAIHVSRGMLEFRADPNSPYFNPVFNKDKNIVLYCASGGRAALAGKTLKDLGFSKVFNLGGYKDWADYGGAIDRAIEPGMKA